MPQRAQSAPVRGRPPVTVVHKPAKPARPTPTHNHTSTPPTHYQNHAPVTSRSARSGRNNILDDFTTRFIKTRNELHARNQQCESLAQEIEKYKKELIQAHGTLSTLEQQESVLKERFEHSKQRYLHEIGHHKTLTHELSQARKEKQERLKERLFLSQELHNHQLIYKQLYEENLKSEEQAKILSKKLQGVNKERLKFRQDCIDNQVTIDDYNAQLDRLQSELKEMRDVVTSSIGDSLSLSHSHSHHSSTSHSFSHSSPHFSSHHSSSSSQPNFSRSTNNNDNNYPSKLQVP